MTRRRGRYGVHYGSLASVSCRDPGCLLSVNFLLSFRSNTASAYDFDFVVAVPNGYSPAFRVVAGGSDCTDYDTDLTGLVQPLSTGSWTTFSTFSV